MVSQRLMDDASFAATQTTPVRTTPCPDCMMEIWKQLGISVSEDDLWQAARDPEFCPTHTRLRAARDASRRALEDLVLPTRPLPGLRRVRSIPPLAVVETTLVAEPPKAEPVLEPGQALVQAQGEEEQARLEAVSQATTVPLAPRPLTELPKEVAPLAADDAAVASRLWGPLPDADPALEQDTLLRGSIRAADRRLFERESGARETAPLGDVQAHERMRQHLADRMAALRAELSQLYLVQRNLELGGLPESPPAT